MNTEKYIKIRFFLWFTVNNAGNNIRKRNVKYEPRVFYRLIFAWILKLHVCNATNSDF